MIVPNKWHRAAYGEKLRRALVEKEQPVAVIDFGHAPIFEDADTFPCILVARRAQPEPTSEVEVCSVPREALNGIELGSFVDRSASRIPLAHLRPGGWQLDGIGVDSLLEKIRRAGAPLREYVGDRPYRGVLTGLNEAFLIDQQTRDRLVAEDPKCEPIIKKFLRGSDIERWHAPWGGEWMIFARRGIEIDRYPSIKAYLSRFRRQLEPRPRDWDAKKKGKWPGRKPGRISGTRSRTRSTTIRLLERRRSSIRTSHFTACLRSRRPALYTNNTCYFVPRDDLSPLHPELFAGLVVPGSVCRTRQG